MARYTLVNNDGQILQSQFTEDENYPITSGRRLLVDEVPEYDSLTQYVVRIVPVPEDADRIVYEIIDIPTPPISEHTVKMHRDFLLEKSDWTQLSDVSLTEEEKNQWKIYRQSLRDITSHPDFPDITFPEPPSQYFNLTELVSNQRNLLS
jgi:hypothetical protein